MMRLQAAANEASIDGVASERLDPFALPVSYFQPGTTGRSSGRAAVTLHRDHAVVTRPGRDGIVTIPVNSFRGIAVRMEASPYSDTLAVVLELNHIDPALSITLVVANDPADVVADWQAWSRSLGLPMLLFEADGSVVEPVPLMGQVLLYRTRPRRRRASSMNHRPRFLVRRKTGRAGELGRIDGIEIIARS